MASLTGYHTHGSQSPEDITGFYERGEDIPTGFVPSNSLTNSLSFCPTTLVENYETEVPSLSEGAKSNPKTKTWTRKKEKKEVGGRSAGPVKRR